MIFITKLTLLATLAGCIVMFLVYTLVKGLGDGVYAGICTFGNVILPTLGAVIIYLIVIRWIKLKNPLVSQFLQTLSLFVLYLSAVLIWAAGEAYLCRTWTLEDVKSVFKSEFSGYLPVVFSHALFIPQLGEWIWRKDGHAS